MKRVILAVVCWILMGAPAWALQGTLTWNDVNNNEDGTKVECRLQPAGAFTQIGQTAATVKTFSYMNFTAGTWDCRVRDFNTGGNGPYSAIVSAAFVNAPGNAPVLQSVTQDPQ